MWSQYAPNMDRDNVLSASFDRFVTVDRALLLRYGGEQYRTHVKDLYVCGTSTHPGGGVHGACAYNALSTMSESL